MKGFSPYRMPGPIFHLSIVALFFIVGLPLCIPGNADVTAPLLALWLIAGLYVGRDLAIQAHYNGLILLSWLAGVIVVLVSPDLLDAMFTRLAAFSRAHYPEGAIAVTTALILGFALWVKWTTREVP